jgi:hypothetical protein
MSDLASICSLDWSLGWLRTSLVASKPVSPEQHLLRNKINLPKMVIMISST